MVPIIVLGRAWAYLGVLGRAWACLGVLGRAWVCLGVLGHAWACLGVLGRSFAMFKFVKCLYFWFLVTFEAIFCSNNN